MTRRARRRRSSCQSGRAPTAGSTTRRLSSSASPPARCAVGRCWMLGAVACAVEAASCPLDTGSYSTLISYLYRPHPLPPPNRSGSATPAWAAVAPASWCTWCARAAARCSCIGSPRWATPCWSAITAGRATYSCWGSSPCAATTRCGGRRVRRGAGARGWHWSGHHQASLLAPHHCNRPLHHQPSRTHHHHPQPLPTTTPGGPACPRHAPQRPGGQGPGGGHVAVAAHHRGPDVRALAGQAARRRGAAAGAAADAAADR